MLIDNYIIDKQYSIKDNWLTIILTKDNIKITYTFSDEDIFSGDYWNCIFVEGVQYDINFFKYPDYKLSIYEVKENQTVYEKFVSI